ncbi:FAD-dependent oxidoreductase [Maribellus maritimus]|uniref:FAD-dependent oxidoreductase n=1 Tax=Maribellus maritimus TaxID=2870838 RepID=UPI001EE9AF69|nr:FAD-dependent oxidoreductase [Maribellus maritimus]MCG6189530.1 FAD-dependent oxidoreductase [Maribellus maritimus]
MNNIFSIKCFAVFLIAVFNIHNLYSSNDKTIKFSTDVCVIGAGSSGIGAALAASRAGAKVVVVEKQDKVGGTSTQAYVNSWEPGPGCSFSQEIFNRLSEIENAVGVCKQVHAYQSDEPYGIFLTDDKLNYSHSLRRSDLNVNLQCSNVVFDVDKFDKTVRQMLGETGNCRLLLNTKFTNAITENSQVKSIEAISTTGEKYIINAKVFIDCTGGAFFCRDIGCEMMLGEESQSRFGEPSAPEQGTHSLNALSLCYQIKPSKGLKKENRGTPDDFKYNVVAHTTGPVGEQQKITVNPLGIIEGDLFLNRERDSVYSYGCKQVDKHWAKLRTYPHFKDYEFDSYAPMLGIRESYRTVCEYVLTQHDLLAGLSGQNHPDIVTVADHPMDIHGKTSNLKILKEAYGVPYRCMLPVGWDNVLIACRGAGFSHIAASSCRLSRTMMSLGHAAGFAAWLCVNLDRPVWNIPVERVQAEMNLKLRPKEILDADPLPINQTIGKKEYSFLCSDNGNDSIYHISTTGEIEWSYPASNCQDIWNLPNGNVLFTYHHGKNGRGGVMEVTKQKKVIFNFETEGEIHTCQRLNNGHTLIGINKDASLVEVDNEGNVRKKIQLKTDKRGHDAIRMARQLKNDNYLVCQEGDNLVAEYNKNGKLLRTFNSPGKCFEAVRLDTGNTIICDGSACSVRELDSKGNVVWRVSKKDFPEIKMNWLAGIDVLSNGNILVCNWLGHGQSGNGIPVFEISKDKKIAVYYTDNVRTKSISNISVIKDK